MASLGSLCLQRVFPTFRLARSAAGSGGRDAVPALDPRRAMRSTCLAPRSDTPVAASSAATKSSSNMEVQMEEGDVHESDDQDRLVDAVIEVGYDLKSVQLLAATEVMQQPYGEPGKTDVGEALLDAVRCADHVNMDKQMEEGNLHAADVQEMEERDVHENDDQDPLVDVVIEADNELKSVQMLATTDIMQQPHEEPGKADVGETLPNVVTVAGHVNMDIQMEKANLHAADVQEMVIDDVIEEEAVCMRKLLRHVTDATSFDDLRTVAGITHCTFKEACEKRGLIETDSSPDDCLTEAATFQMPYAMRTLFAIILVFWEDINNIHGLWDKHKNAMGEDYSRENCNAGEVEQKVLRDIRDMVESMGKDFRDYGLPDPDLNYTGIDVRQQTRGEQGNNNVAHSMETLLNSDHADKSVQVETCTEIGQEACVIHMAPLDILHESTKASTDAQLLEHTDKSCRHNKPKKGHIAQVLPQDYICDSEDIEILQYIRSSPAKKIMVDISGAFVDRKTMECLFHDDRQVNGDVLSAYIHCIRGEEHLLRREDGAKVFLENTYTTSILRRDGFLAEQLIHYKEDIIEHRVDNYLDHDMVFFPINIELVHWYLAVLNPRQHEIHVLDSMGSRGDRSDLHYTILGLHRHIKLAAQHKQLNREKLHDLDILNWPYVEKIKQPMQSDGASCGLWMINYMEYWTGSHLSDPLTQEDITNVRLKLPVILWDSRLNTRKGYDHSEVTDEEMVSPSDVELIESLAEAPQEIQTDASLPTLPTGISLMTKQELSHALLMYITSIDDESSLEKEWIRSNNPFPISLNLKKLKQILDTSRPPMDKDCFNMAVRILGCNEFIVCLEEEIFHFMDLQFFTISDFGRHPLRRAKLDVQRLGRLFEPWAQIKYHISDCSKILLPYSILGHFILFSLDMDSRTVSILDPMPIPHTFKGRDPTLYYVHKIHNIANNLKLVMDIADPAWNDNIYLWRRILPTSVPKIDDWNLSGFLVINFMRYWDGKQLPLISTNGDALRTMFLINLLKFRGNEAKDNIPKDIREIIRRVAP